MKKIYLIDGSSFLYRAYYGLRPMHTSMGEPVQAVYGFCRMIKKIIDTHAPECMILVWDSKGKTERHVLYEEYKATRQAPPSDLFTQKERIIEFADLIGLKQISQIGVEADDLLYSLAHSFEKQKIDTVVISSDKDLGQMLNEHITLFDPFKDEFVTPEMLELKYGVPLSKLIFYFALIGDSSDNIPGVKGIGPKGAQELVNQFDSLDDLYTRIELVKKERTRELLRASRDNAFLSEALFKLKLYETPVDLIQCAISVEQWAQARPLFEKLEFKSLLKDLPILFEQQTFLEQKTALNYNYVCVTTEEQLVHLSATVRAAGVCAIDTETTGIKTLQSDIVGISVCVQEGTAYYIPYGHINAHQLSKEAVFLHLKPILEDSSIKKYLQNSKFDQLMFAHQGIELRGVVFDTMIAASLVVKDWQRLNLKALSEHYLHETMITYAELAQKYKTHNFAEIPLEDAVLYAAADAHQTFRLVPILKKELEKHEQVNLFESIEFPLVDILYHMEKEGIFCDAAELAHLDRIVTTKLTALQQLITDIIGHDKADINLNSPKQLEQLLFEVLQLPRQKKTAGKTGYSTDQEVLLELSKLHPVPGLIIKYRELFKLKSTYIETLPSYINPYTRKIHTHFSQVSAATGRLASSEPNMQNIPLAYEDGLSIRAAFKPAAGHVYLSVDYSQIELRVLAYLSQDANLLAAFARGEDIHARTAAALFNVEILSVTHEQRQLAKRINFSILYGLTPYGLSKDLDIPFSEAKEYIEKYFAQYPGVVAFIEKTIEFTKQHGYVVTWQGRRRYIPGIHEKNKSLYELACRVAVNTAAQGTAAELMKLGMILLHKQFTSDKYNAHMLLQIHDELLISVPQEYAQIIEKNVKDVLQASVDWNVPLVVTTRIGANWAEVTK